MASSDNRSAPRPAGGGAEETGGRVHVPPLRVPKLLRNGHVQTLLGAYWAPPRVAESACRHLLPLTDGDRLVLHDVRPEDWRPGGPVVVLLHGLGGCHRSPYQVRLVEKLRARGVRSVRVDLRGFGASFATARRPGHAGCSQDVAAVIDFLRSQCPDSPLGLVGYSMGGNITLKLLGEYADTPPAELRAAASIGPPIDIMYCAQKMRFGLQKVYSNAFLSNLLTLVRQRRALFPELAEIPLEPRPAHIIEFDSRFTAPLGGFRSVRDYYFRASAAPLLEHIHVPTLLLAAEDDPIIPAKIFRNPRLSPAVHLHLSPHGGHLGFIGDAGGDPDRRWMDWRILDWLFHHL